MNAWARFINSSGETSPRSWLNDKRYPKESWTIVFCECPLVAPRRSSDPSINERSRWQEEEDRSPQTDSGPAGLQHHDDGDEAISAIHCLISASVVFKSKRRLTTEFFSLPGAYFT